MAEIASNSRVLRYWSRNFDTSRRVETWREELARGMLQFDVVPLADGPFGCEATLCELPGLRVGKGAFDASMNRRTREMAARDTDDFVMVVNLEGPLIAEQGGREISLGRGDGFVLAGSETGSLCRSAEGALLGLRFPRAALESRVPDIYDGMARVIPHNTEALRLLARYASDLDNGGALGIPQLRDLVVKHVYDLLALALNPSPDILAIAEDGGLRTARRHSVKVFVARNIHRPELSIDHVVASERLSPRQIQRVFERDGTTFSAYVLTLRLRRAHAMLRDSRNAYRTIGDIVFECGFGDISNFNRAFRKFYGATPTDIRKGN